MFHDVGDLVNSPVSSKGKNREGAHRDSRAPRYAHSTMNKHLSPLCPRTVDPIAKRLELRSKTDDTAAADTSDIKDLDMTLTFFDPKRAVTSRSFTGDELTCRRHVVCMGALNRGEGVKRWRNESALANGDDMHDNECMKHIHI